MQTMTEQPNRTTALTRRRRWGRRLGVTVGVILALMAIVLLWVATLDINDCCAYGCPGDSGEHESGPVAADRHPGQ